MENINKKGKNVTLKKNCDCLADAMEASGF